MTDYRAILRLDSLKLQHKQIAESLGVSRTTVLRVLRRAQEVGLGWNKAQDMGDKAVSEALFPTTDGKLHYNDKFEPLSQNSFRRIWWSLMQDAGCVVDREVTEDTSRPNDILKRLKPTLTPHYFRHNYVTLLYESGVDPLVAMKMVGHRDYQTTANIYTHLKEDSLKKAAADMATVFRKKDAKQVKKAVGGVSPWGGMHKY